MNHERWIELMNDQLARLSAADMDAGWHWCYEWDGLLVGPGMEELEACCCDYPEVLKAKELMREKATAPESHSPQEEPPL